VPASTSTAAGRAGPPVADLLRRAAAARTAGRLTEARAAWTAAFGAARSASDAGGMVAAALGLAAVQRFGAHPGRLPAFVHEARSATTDPVERVRLTAVLARTWAYGGDPVRADVLAAEALTAARAVGDPVLVADALDARLTTRWGPDHLAERLALSRALLDAAAHVGDAEVALTAALWALTTAVERLDAVTVERQLHALTGLAEETGTARIRCFAASRAAMWALVRGDLATADALLEGLRTTGAAEADLDAVEHELRADRMRLAGDRAGLTAEAAGFQAVGEREGFGAVLATAALLWVEVGDPRRAAAVLGVVTGGGLGRWPRDVNWLVTVGAATAAAAALGEREVADEGLTLLAPCAGRAIVTAGGVTFRGVVDDVCARAARALGRHDEALHWRRAALDGYRRVRAPWWSQRLQADVPVVSTTRPRAADRLRADRPAEPADDGVVWWELRPVSPTVWSVGRADEPTLLPDRKGLHHLRHLLDRPDRLVSAVELVAAVAGHAGRGVVDGDLGPVVDAQALAPYRDRLREIDGELERATRSSDAGGHDRLAAEREALLEQLGQAIGLVGRPRRGASTGERARVAVRKAIAAALEAIARTEPDLARLLRDRVRTGTHCVYEADPARPVRWRLG
jgi:hypothetical protein